ncbi:MAG: hypothetical protein DWQ51_03370 [Microcystis wesenbergii TW10]|jgi:hypothetical protein|uniref:Transposase n=2 Tax=Microcystis wesenbergii TaxID=44823 RepID=A0ABU3HIB3_9CHRO|nr:MULTISPECIES: hypothetical protein [Microcystis]MDT3674213.1 hypothetical protein [Microcystis wesenbergii NRERC-220]REJ57180.1 MAG: hypothetical protein DWQ51_03370 [Microcystis wesenbergii TW10]
MILGSEILIFIHRPGEDFSDLLKRWRETQICLDKEYEWLMPPREQQMFIAFFSLLRYKSYGF